VLEKRFRPVLQKRLGLALGVWGEAGIGKSYQVRELLRTLPCQSLSLHATTSFSLLSQTLPRPKKLALWAEHNLKRLAQGEALEGSSVLDSLGSLLSGLAPFVLHLEDIHEVDNERLAFLRELAKVVLRTKGVALVITSRKEPPQPFTAIKLGSLTRQDSDLLLEQELKTPLPKEALAWLYDKAAGNPLYTLEYLRYLTRGGFLWNDGKSWHWRKPEHAVMPVTVEALIEQLLTQAKTDPLQRYVLEARAFLPLDSGQEVWQRVARVDALDLQTALRELSRQGIFKDHDFAHPLFREVAFKMLSTERKQHLARRTINVLGDGPERAAMFVNEAELEPSRALELLKKAAERVKERNVIEAATWLAEAVTYAGGEEKGKLALEAARKFVNGGYSDIFTLTDIALAHAQPRSQVLELQAQAYGLQGQPASMRQVITTLAESEPPNLQWFEKQITLLSQGAWYPEVIALWEKYPEFHQEASPRTMFFVAWVIADKGDLTHALSLVEEQLQNPQLSLQGRALMTDVYGCIMNFKGEYARADTSYSEALLLYQRLYQSESTQLSNNAVATVLCNRALNRLQLGKHLESISDIEAALTSFRERGFKRGYAQTLDIAGLTYLDLGDYERAEEALAESFRILTEVESTSYLVSVYAHLVHVYSHWRALQLGPLLASKYLANCLEVARNFDDPYYLFAANLAAFNFHLAFGEPGAALEASETALGYARRSEVSELLIDGLLAKGEALLALRRSQEAALVLQEAERLTLGKPKKLKDVQLLLAYLNNDLDRAREHVKWFQERGLINSVNIAKRYFPEFVEAKEAPKETANTVRLEVLGSLQITGQTTTSVRGRKRQELLARLLEARISGRSEVSRLTLLDTLYSNENERKANANLKTMVHDLRGTLGNNAVLTTTNGYALGECNSDAEQFLQIGDTSLWRGSYLESLDLSEESSVRDSLYLLLFEKAKVLLETNPNEAARVSGFLIKAEPYRTDYLKTYLTALRLGNSHRKLGRHYQAARERLLEVNETLPETWQGFLS
jgi:tetratricopeptide (TPR) repeat protein